MKEEYWRILTKTTDWVKYSDTKAVIILTIHGVVLTIIYSNATEVFNHLSTSNFATVVTIIAAVFTSLSILFSFLAINPRLKNPNPSSIIYFGHIQEEHNNYEDYLTKSREVLGDDATYEKQLAEQVYINSQVAWKKFKNVSYSIRCFAVALFFLLINLVVYFVSQ